MCACVSVYVVNHMGGARQRYMVIALTQEIKAEREREKVCVWGERGLRQEDERES